MSRMTQRCSIHPDPGHGWALILAAGEGSRLQALTATASARGTEAVLEMRGFVGTSSSETAFDAHLADL